MQARNLVPPARIAGGFASVDARAFARAWTLIYQDGGRQGDLRLRVLFASIECITRRRAAGARRALFTFDEICDLCAGRRRDIVAGVRWLIRARILAADFDRTGSSRGLAVMPGEASPAAGRILDLFGNRQRLAVPRRLLRWIAGQACGIRARAAVAIAACGRAIWPAAGGCRLAGRLRLVDVAGA